MENFLWRAQRICGQGILSYPMPGHIALPMVAARDIAEAALHRLVRRDWIGVRAVSIVGPAEISFEQAALTMERVLNRNIEYTEVSADTFIQELVQSGSGINYARSIIETFKDWTLDLPRGQTRTAELIGLTSLAEWTKRELLPMLDAFGPPTWPEPTPVRLMEPTIA